MKKVEVRKIGKHGRGVFACEDFKKGEFIIGIKGREVSRAELFAMSDYINSHAGTIGRDKYLIFGYPEKYINHSCDPNSYEYKRKVIAIRGIKKGEEITFDYSICSIDNWRMKCRCGSKKCRKIVRGNFFRLPRALQKKYIQYIDEWFRKEFKNELRQLEK